jgi:ATP-dependent RNA helicase DeaD
MLRLTYDIRPIERQLPTETELRTRAELDLVQFFIEAFGGRPCAAEDLALARRLLTHADGERIVAALLREHLGAKEARTATGSGLGGRSAAEQAAEARRARPPTPVATPGEPSERATDDEANAPISKDVPTLRRGAAPRRDEDRSDRAERRGRAERREPPADAGLEVRRPGDGRPEPRKEPRRERPEPGSAERPSREVSRGTLPAAGSPDDFVSVYVNVGKREGLSASDVEALLSRGGIDQLRVGAIRLRDRMTFVEVPRSELDRACAALSGHDFGGRVSAAEAARER